MVFDLIEVELRWLKGRNEYACTLVLFIAFTGAKSLRINFSSFKKKSKSHILVFFLKNLLDYILIFFNQHSEKCRENSHFVYV